MICPECRYEYFSKKDVHLFKCPVCKSNFIKSIIDYSNDSNPLNLFRDAIRYMGTELLKDKQTLLKLIPKLYHSDLILSKLLVISVNEAIAAGMYNLIQVEDRDGKLNSLKQKLITEAFLSEDAAHKIIDSWCYVLDFDENENTIKNCSNSIAKSNYLLNSKGEIIYVNKNDNFNIFFSEGLAYTGGNRNGQYYINVKGENVLDLNALISPQVVNLKNEFYEWNYNYGDFQDGLAFLERNIGIKKYGFIDKKAKIIINCIYEEALPFSEQLAAVKLDGLWGFINTKGETVIKHKYDKAFQFHDGIALVEGNGNWTFIDKKGDIKLSLNKYKDVQPFNEGLARVKNDKYGYIDKLGNEIISLKYNDTKSISNDFIPVKIKKWGVINKNDEIIVPFEFDYVKILEIDSIIVGKKVPPYNHEEYIYGLYSKLGDELLKVEYNSIHAVDKDTMFVKKIEIENCIDDDGREFEDENELFGLYIISENKLSKMKNSYENSYNSDSKVNNYKNLIITDYYDGIALACEGYFEKSYLYLDKKGKLLIDRKFKEATDFVNGISKVEIYLPDLNLGIENHPCYKYGFRSFNKYGTGYINKRGKWIYSSRNSVDNNLTTNHFYKYDMVIPNSFGLNSACINGVWCIVDNSGKEIIGLKYHLMYCIDENIIGYRGKINEEFKWGLMDRNEKIIAPCKYNNLPFFEGNLSMVFYENKVGCIDKEGNETIPLIYDSINLNPIYEDLFAAEIDKKWGVINIFGETVIDFIYDGIRGSFGDGFAIVSTRRHYRIYTYPNSYGLIDLDGTPILPDICRQIGYRIGEVNGFNGDEIERNYFSLNIFHEGIVKFQLGDKWNFISIDECKKIQQNSEFLYKTNIDFSEYEYFNEDLLRHKKLELEVELSIEPDYIEQEYEYDYQTELKQNFITFYKSIVRGVYDEVGVSKNGVIRIKKDNKYSFIDCLTKEPVSVEYDFAMDFRQGIAKVNFGGKFIEDSYEGSNDLVFVRGKWGYINEKFEVQIPIEFDMIDGFYDGVSNAKIEGKSVKIDLFGNIISYL